MITRALIAVFALALAAGFLASDADAKKRNRNHWFYDYYYPEPEYIPPPRYYRFYGYDEAYDDDFEEDYYDPYYEPSVRKVKPAKKKPAKAQTAVQKQKKTTTKTVAKSGPETEAKATAKSAVPTETKAATGQPKAKSTGGLSCEKAGTIVSGYGFSGVKASDCDGKVYAFDAERDGKSYAIKLNPVSGELTEVRKVR